MFTVHITEKGGSTSSKQFDKAEIAIGRIHGNDIVLPKSNISKRHARIADKGGLFVITDSNSTNGTYVNGKRIDEPYELGRGDKIYLGDFTLEIEPKFEDVSPPRVTPSPSQEPINETLEDNAWNAGGDLDDDWADEWDDPRLRSNQSDSADRVDDSNDEVRLSAPLPETSGIAKNSGLQASSHWPEDEPIRTALRDIHDKLLKTLDLRRMHVDSMDDTELRERTRAVVDKIVRAMARDGKLPRGIDPGTLTEHALDEALGLGPLEDFLADDKVTEILVNGARHVYIEVDGKLELTGRTFSSDQAVFATIERIVAPLGRRIDESSPMVDARLRDGSRVNAIIPPLALNGPVITIRKFTRERLSVSDLVSSGSLNQDIADFLEIAVRAKQNIVISGGTGSGKTTILNVLSSFIPGDERIITIEDAAELRLEQAHVVRLESRPANIEGSGAIAIRDLMRNALRMRPDRIVIGECRGGEALDMLQAMNTGHEGSLSTVHANSTRDALSRMETMVLMSGLELPVRAIREQISSAIDLVIQQSRFPDGSRRIARISEVTGQEGDVISMQDIFVFEQQGFDDGGRLIGEFCATGFVPKFYDDLGPLGIRADRTIFG